jgi:methyltransferase-like protein/ubiquinone/menaquinone biosynthesis C-methylase UbiE
VSTLYNEVEYTGFPYPDTHPDRLATLATLFGMSPPRVSTCRVLELGCGDGANLVAIAIGLPNSTCVGIDLAEHPIERARACVAALGLTNVTFHCGDIAALDGDLGTFDYVIAHGVYSWVPPHVRDRLLAECRGRLAPEGVAFVSYNAYPGGHLCELVRGLMTFRARALPPDAMRRVNEGLALVKWVMDSTPSDPLRQILTVELDSLARRDPRAVFHDELAPTYAPVYFHEFVDHARRHGLQYLAEAEFSSMQSSRFPSPLAELLHKIGDVVVKEQLQDFLRLRKFRQTLLCHREVALDPPVEAARVRSLWVASAARPDSPSRDLTPGVPETFRRPDDVSMSTNDPVAKAAFHCLADAWPRAMAFEELQASVRAELRDDAAARDGRLESAVMTSYGGAFVELHVHPPSFALTVNERPRASPLARWQLERGSTVTTLRHASISIDDALLRHLVLLLDGTRDHATLHRELTEIVRSGAARLERQGRQLTDDSEIADVLSRELPAALAGVARLPLLVG